MAVVMKTIRFPTLTERNCWFLENRRVRIAVEKRTGFIRSFLFKKQRVDLFQIRRQDIPGYLGYLRVYDQRDDRWYNDLKDPFRIVRASRRGNRVTLTKRFVGAPFLVTVVLDLSDEGLSWEVRATKARPNVRDRSLRVGFNLPLQASWRVWAPCRDGDFVFDGMDAFNFNHVQVSYVSPRDVILPMVSHYSRDLDVGYSVLAPLDAPTPMASFQFENGDKGFNWGSQAKPAATLQTLEAMNAYIGLVGDRPMSTGVRVLFHAGDWRPALEQVFDQYRNYFVPDSPAIYDSEGCFKCGSIDVADALDEHLALGLKTLEVHGHFSWYGDYYQDGSDRWLRLNILERLYHTWNRKGTPKDAWEVRAWIDEHSLEDVAVELYGHDWPSQGVVPERDFLHHRDHVRRQIERIAEAGIAPFWYFNYSDGFRPEAEGRWPDALCRDAQGNPIPSGWHMCHNLNADLRTSFGRFCLDSAKKILAEHPDLRGFFLDCFRHYEIDFAHDDGVTVVDNRPAYSVNFSYDELTRRIKEHMKSLGRPLSLFANKPQTIRSMRHVDGVLLEGDGDISEEKYFWACLAKPIFFMWTSDRHSTDESLRRAVLHGCFPKCGGVAPERQKEMERLYQRYLPLYEQFRRRVFCFEPDPLRVPRGARGKLFTVGRGYVAGIMTPTIDSGDRVRYGRTPYALFRVKRGWNVGRVGVMV
ncbi:hypothetical protein HQ560_10010, partial [bacterium]|nr:hypothetical protein [bacterium]